jgi:hypothetical protein
MMVECLETFPNTTSLLGYLRICVMMTVMDRVRARGRKLGTETDRDPMNFIIAIMKEANPERVVTAPLITISSQPTSFLEGEIRQAKRFRYRTVGQHQEANMALIT